MTQIKRIMLDAPITSTTAGKESKNKYRAFLSLLEGRAVVQLRYMTPDGEEWHGTPGLWALSTLLGCDGFSFQTPFEVSDTISIDYGQRWEATGMRAAVAEAVDKLDKLLG